MNEAEILASLAQYGISENFHGGIVRYLIHGIPPGSFLTAVICNELWTAVCSCGSRDFNELLALSKWMLNEGSATTTGSRDKLDWWIQFKTAERRQAVGPQST